MRLFSTSRLPLAPNALKLRPHMKTTGSLRGLRTLQKQVLAFDTSNPYKRASVRTQKKMLTGPFFPPALIHDVCANEKQGLQQASRLDRVFHNYQSFPIHACVPGGAPPCIFIVRVPTIATVLAQDARFNAKCLGEQDGAARTSDEVCSWALTQYTVPLPTCPSLYLPGKPTLQSSGVCVGWLHTH